MAISVTSLRNELVGGGARSSLFYVNINFPTISTTDAGTAADGEMAGIPTDKVSFFIKSASIPASEISAVPISFLGREFKVPSLDRTFENWNVTIINDTNFKIRHIFEAWMELITPSAAIFDSMTGFGTDNSFYGSMSVHQLDTKGDNSTFGGTNWLGSYYFVDVFPVSVSSIGLSWDDKDKIEEFDVTFAYQYFEKKPTIDPTNGNDNAESPFKDDNVKSWAKS